MTTKPLTLIAKLTARPDKVDTLGAALAGLIAPTLREEGAIDYRLHRGENDHRVFVLYETWRSRADLDAHFEEPHPKAVLAMFPTLLAVEMELTFCTMVFPKT